MPPLRVYAFMTSGATGRYGRAEKAQVGEMVRLLLNLREVPQPHDAADALGAAICHIHHAGTIERILAAEAGIRP